MCLAEKPSEQKGERAARLPHPTANCHTACGSFAEEGNGRDRLIYIPANTRTGVPTLYRICSLPASLQLFSDNHLSRYLFSFPDNETGESSGPRGITLNRIQAPVLPRSLRRGKSSKTLRRPYI